MKRTELVHVLLCLVSISEFAASYSNPLDGRRAPCQLEGEPVAVDHIDKQKCYSCICKNGFVECKNDYFCPPTDGCHMLVEKTKDGCCQKCKGCIYGGASHLSHTEWTDPNNPCRVFRCEAGVVTESDLQCHTPCANPIPPEPGRCCSTCPECKINGQIATDDRDVISDDDPCLKCRCSKGKMICSKRACPVLQCHKKFQHHPLGECCPRCSGTRTLYTVRRTCTLESAFIREGQKFNTDKCTNCTCVNETSICTRAACPVLDCAPDLQKPVPGSCCKKCIVPEEVRTQCSYNGQYYEDGQSWQLDACRSCKCHKGMPSCAMTRCNITLPCAPGTQLIREDGECCPKCVEVEGVCMVFGDPHYKTFDGKIYTFRGVGKYQLVSDCDSQTFSIRVANDYANKSIKNLSTKRVAVRLGELRLNLQQKGRIKLNRKRVKAPYRRDRVRIEKRADNLEVFLDNGVKIVWSGRSFLEVSIPTSFKNKVCGLCGNFNGNVQDELKTRRGRIVQDADILQFGSSWCVGTKKACVASANFTRFATAEMSSCVHRNDKHCKLLTKPELFGECESKLNNNKYYKTCKMDMCRCPNGKCYCDSLLAYARECERLGVGLPEKWQKLSSCDADSFRNKSRKSHGKGLSQMSDVDIRTLLQSRKHRNNSSHRPRTPILIQ